MQGQTLLFIPNSTVVLLILFYHREGSPMHTQRAYSHLAEGLSRRELLHMGLAAGLTVSVLPLSCSRAPLGRRSGTAQARRHPARAWL